ncbi:TPA: hypothetical protein ACH3X1_014373 [Trebouxia sp. C0004]
MLFVDLPCQAYSLPGLQTPQRSEDQGWALICKCARGEANKDVAAAAQAARATAPPPPRQQQAQEPHATVAMDPSALLHQHGISLDQLAV